MIYNYEKEKIITKIKNILDLNNKITHTLYELDNNLEIQQDIMNLIPELKIHYNLINLEKLKRPWLWIIKNILNSRYNIIVTNIRIKINNIPIKTRQYYFSGIPITYRFDEPLFYI